MGLGIKQGREDLSNEGNEALSKERMKAMKASSNQGMKQ